MSSKQWQHAERVLCVRLDYMGDVLMSTPAIRALRQSLPGRHITLLTSASGSAAARYIPEVDDTIVYAAPWLKSSAQHTPADDIALIERLKAGRYDAAVIFTVYSQNPLPTAMMCYLAGIPLRLAHCRENPYQLLTHWVRDNEPHEHVRHEVQRQLDLVSTIGAHADDEHMSMTVPAADHARVTGRLQELGVDPDKPWIVIHPGATAASRRYPPERFAAAARLLRERLRCPIVFTGSADEAALVDGIRAGIEGCHSLAGQLQLGELAALISQAPLLISNNTGPAHIAAAVGTPVVDLYALTNPQHTPWQVPNRVLFHEVPCGFCYKSVCPQGHNNCLTMVEPRQILHAALELLQPASTAAQVSQVIRLSSVLQPA